MIKRGKFGVTCATEERESGQELDLQFQVQSWESSEKVSVLELAFWAMLYKSHSFLKPFSPFQIGIAAL